MEKPTFIPIDINAEKLEIPSGYDLVITEKGNLERAAILYGFHEIGLFDHEFKNPQYGFYKTT